MRTGVSRARWALVCGLLFAAAQAPAQESSATRRDGPPGAISIQALDLHQLRDAVRDSGEFSVALNVPGRSLQLTLKRFRVATSSTRFVIGGPDGDTPLDFDPERIVLLRGHAAGYPASRVMIALDGPAADANIDLGPGLPRFAMTTRSSSAAPLATGDAAFLATEHSTEHQGDHAPIGAGASCGGVVAPEAVPAGYGDRAALPGRRQLQLAIETDFEYFQLFGDEQAAAAYIVKLYGAVSDIYARDVNTHLHLTYVRIWPDNTDPAFTSSTSPLSAFAGYWNSTMGGVVRDAAQYVSGRRNLSAGGVAYLSSLCNNNAYSWAGYIHGEFFNPDRVEWTNRDIFLTAHELGHNCGTNHTDAYGLDSCNTGIGRTRRGSIMSYCGQGYSGGDLNHDLWFHEVTAQRMRNYMATRSACLALDCNENSVADSIDISSGVSADVNGNQVPDECEDCNGNGMLDPAEIALGFAADVNTNGVPDACEPDCNGNGAPDAWETVQTPATDLNANRVPDSCEGDCDGDGAADYNEILVDMALDINRNTILDTCEDCDNDGVLDEVELDQAWNVVLGALDGDTSLAEFHALSGVRTARFPVITVPGISDVCIAPGPTVLASVPTQNRIARFTRAGDALPDLVAPGGGGLLTPNGMCLTPAGTLLVVSTGSSSVIEFDGTTGAPVRTLVAAGAGGLTAPHGILLAGNRLLVSCEDNSVREYDATTGDFVRVLVAAGAGGLSGPRGMLMKADGRLLVCSFGTDTVIEYDGATGAAIGPWNRNGIPGVLDLDQPWCIRLGPDGDVYVSRSGPLGFAELHQSDPIIMHFDIRNGNYKRCLVQGHDTGIHSAAGFAFFPGDHTDCNTNNAPDSCDISLGTSLDCNGDNRPDECTPPCPAAVCRAPQSITVRAGEPVTLTVAAGGVSAYAWRRGGTPLTDGGRISGAGSAALTIDTALTTDSGSYDVRLDSPCGAVVTAAATLTVLPACPSADYNGDGDSGTDADIEAFFACLGGACCPACSADIDGDGDVGTDADVESFFRVLAGGTC